MGLVSWIKRRIYLSQYDHLGKPKLTSTAVKFLAGGQQDVSTYAKIILDFLTNGLPLRDEDMIETDLDNIKISRDAHNRGHFVGQDDEYDRVFCGISNLVGNKGKNHVKLWRAISEQTGRKWSVTTAPIEDSVTWRSDSDFTDWT